MGSLQWTGIASGVLVAESRSAPAIERWSVMPPLFSPFGLPHADKLFLRFFDRWYSPLDRQAKSFPATRPDMMAVPALVGRDAAAASSLSADDAAREMQQVEAMLAAARADWPSYLSVSEPIDLEWVRAFDAYYDKKRVRELIDRSQPDQFGNDYLVIACEFGAVLGTVLLAKVERLQWLAARPYWESSLFDPQTGNVIPVFHWAVKKLSGYGLTDGFVEKIEACIRVLGGRPAG